MKSLSDNPSRFNLRVRGTILDLAIAIMLLAGSNPTIQTNAISVSCDDTWFRQGIESHLKIDWNTPLPVLSTDIESIPSPGPEGPTSPIVQLSESEITDEFADFIDITISGINPGQRVILEKYMVSNPEQGIEPGSLLQGSYILQDGYTPSSGEVYNFNVPNDFSETEGEIVAQLDFYEPSPSSIVGSYIYRVKSPTNAYPPRDIPFEVRAEEWDQKFHGTVTSNGAPVPNAFVVLLDPLGLDNDFVKGTIADEEGRYTIFSDFNEYDLVAVSPGFVGPYGRDVSHFIDENESLSIDLSLVPGDRTISGTLVDAGNPSQKLPGIEVILLSLDEANQLDKGLFAICWTDQEGNFSAEVTKGRWGITPRLQAVYDRGYQSPGLYLGAVADATEGDSEGHQIALSKGESLVWGTLTSATPNVDGDHDPLCGVEIRAVRQSDGAAAHAVTDGDGDYRLAVGPGYWNVFAVPYSLFDSQHTSPFPSDIKIPSTPSSILYDFSARPIDAWVYGWAETENGDPIGKFELRAINFASDTGEIPYQNTYDTDGFFEFGLASGNWTIIPEPLEAARRQLIFSSLPQIVVEPLSLDEEATDIEVTLKTVPASAFLSLTITSPEGTPIPGIPVHGMMQDAAGSDLHSFGVSDVSGIARLAVTEGHWMFHPSENSLREEGFIEIATFELPVTDESQQHSIVAKRAQQSKPKFTISHSPVPRTPRFQAKGEAGQRYIIEASTQLDEWREFGRVIAESGSFTVSEEGNSESKQLFLRARPE